MTSTKTRFSWKLIHPFVHGLHCFRWMWVSHKTCEMPSSYCFIPERTWLVDDRIILPMLSRNQSFSVTPPGLCVNHSIFNELQRQMDLTGSECLGGAWKVFEIHSLHTQGDDANGSKRPYYSERHRGVCNIKNNTRPVVGQFILLSFAQFLYAGFPFVICIFTQSL